MKHTNSSSHPKVRELPGLCLYCKQDVLRLNVSMCAADVVHCLQENGYTVEHTDGRPKSERLLLLPLC
jgi:hypothetical protein